jgi:hypothetical protein
METPTLPDRSYNYHLGDDSNEVLDPVDDGEEWQYRPLSWRTTLKRTLCCNAPIQGACAEAAMRALTLVDAALIEFGIDGGPVIFNHDEIVLEVPEADAERAGTILVESMTRAFAETFPAAPLNGLVETKIVTAWGPRESHTTAEPVDGDARRPDLPARGVPCPADRGDTAASADQRGRAAGRGLGPRERVDVPSANTGLIDEGLEEVQRKPKPSAAFLARTCDHCGASPCTVFGETTAFCTLQCWQASYASS